MNFFEQLRLDFIDFRLSTVGSIRRADLTQAFGISVPTASGDLQAFIGLYPSAMKYDATAKCYVAKRNPYSQRRDRRLGVDFFLTGL